MTRGDLARAEAVIGARGLALGAPLTIVDETTSTNDDAKRAAKAGAPHGAVWIAERQTRGRGRYGRRWESPAGENLLFSVLLRVRCPAARVPPLALVCGLAVRDAVAGALGDDRSVLVKWPNDVLVESADGAQRRKVAGVLVESALTGSAVEHVVCGIGINVQSRSFPPELEASATSIAIERGARGLSPDADRAEVLAEVLAGLEREVEHAALRGLVRVHARLSQHDALRGAPVEVDGRGGLAEGIDADGRLLVRRQDGALVRIASGEVTLGAPGPRPS